MSAEPPGPLPGPHADRSRPGLPSPERLDAWEGWRDGGARAFYEDAIRLPGFGQQPERCRQRKPVGFCDLAGHVTLASASPCETRRCPEHWGLWQREAAVNMVARLAAYRHVQDGAEKRLLHVIDSPDPERRWTAEAFWGERSRSYEVLGEAGGRGGAAVPHAYRTNDRGDALFRAAVESGDWEKEWGKWSLLRRTADDWGEMKRFLEAGPHFHHLVAAEDFDPDAIPARRVVKNRRSLKPFHIRDMTGYRDMARWAMYVLSHAAFEPRRSAAGREVPGRTGADGRPVTRTQSPATVTYWGEVHPNGFKPEDELTAAEWETIQRMAERAVTTRPADDLEDAGSEPERMSCPHEGCEGDVISIDELREWLGRGEWVRSLPRRQRQILNGVLMWLDNMGDRPPPSTDGARIREWLMEWGRRYEQSHQVGVLSYG
jgi:hypothetical protein